MRPAERLRRRIVAFANAVAGIDFFFGVAMLPMIEGGGVPNVAAS
jgi:hypothetical protein